VGPGHVVRARFLLAGAGAGVNRSWQSHRGIVRTRLRCSKGRRSCSILRIQFLVPAGETDRFVGGTHDRRKGAVLRGTQRLTRAAAPTGALPRRGGILTRRTHPEIRHLGLA